MEATTIRILRGIGMQTTRSYTRGTHHSSWGSPSATITRSMLTGSIPRGSLVMGGSMEEDAVSVVEAGDSVAIGPVVVIAECVRSFAVHIWGRMRT